MLVKLLLLLLYNCVLKSGFWNRGLDGFCFLIAGEVLHSRHGKGLKKKRTKTVSKGFQSKKTIRTKKM